MRINDRHIIGVPVTSITGEAHGKPENTKAGHVIPRPLAAGLLILDVNYIYNLPP